MVEMGRWLPDRERPGKLSGGVYLELTQLMQHLCAEDLESIWLMEGQSQVGLRPCLIRFDFISLLICTVKLTILCC